MGSAFDTPGAGNGPVLDISNLATKTDVSEGFAPLATSDAVEQTRSDILAAVAAAAAASSGAGATQGEVRRFIQGSVPAGWQTISDDPVFPSTGVLLKVRYGSGFAMCAYVASGAGAGHWIHSAATMQRVDLGTAANIGPAYVCGSGRGSASLPFMVAIGKYIYLGGGSNGSNAPITDLLRFDTETGALATLSALPRAINDASAVVLNDGRILFRAFAATGMSQTVASTGFWIYNPTTNITAVEVSVALPLLNVSDAGNSLVKMPSGAVMVIEGNDATTATATMHTTRYSCLLTVTGNSIVAGPAENSGYASGNYSPVMLASAAGCHMWQSGQTRRSYVEGSGWGAAAFTPTHVSSWAGQVGELTSSAQLPNNSGWLFLMVSGGTHYGYVLLTGANAPGAPIIYAKKL